jgi:molybdopterin-guanine dinucleotide biosynthesis protein A
VELGGQTLLGRALDVASAVTGDCRIVGDPAKFAVFGPVVEDIFRECGPLGGIHAALLSAKSELNLMLAVDLPFMKAKFLEYLIVQARETSAVVTVPHAGGGLQPLCAIYRRKFVEVAERALRKRKNKIDPLFAEVETRVLDEGELSRAGFSLDIFRNLNTLEHWEEAKEQVKLRQSFRTELKGG